MKGRAMAFLMRSIHGGTSNRESVFSAANTLQSASEHLPSFTPCYAPVFEVSFLILHCKNVKYIFVYTLDFCAFPKLSIAGTNVSYSPVKYLMVGSEIRSF